ncbi:MAG: hypothetical protein AAGC81_02420 [Pseudomonadota bacterium]
MRLSAEEKIAIYRRSIERAEASGDAMAKDRAEVTRRMIKKLEKEVADGRR